MKVTTVYTAIAALVLLFISIVTWVFNSKDIALLAANLATIMLLVVYLLGNRKNDKN